MTKGEGEQVTTVEVEEAPAAQDKKPVTMDDLADAGLEKAEIEMAKKHGVLTEEKAEEPKEGDPHGKTETKKEVPETKGNGLLKKGESLDERFRVIADGRPPEKVISEIAEKGDLSKDQEAVLLASLTQNGKNLYWAQKHERHQKQRVSSERDELKNKLSEKEKAIEDLQRQIDSLKKRPDSDEDQDPLNLDGRKKVEENQDPKKKPLTEEDLDRLKKAEKDKEKAEEAKRFERASVVKEALEDQRAEAETRYEDFTDVMQFTGEIIQAANAGKLAELYPDPKVRSRIEREVSNLLVAFAHADEFESDEENPADMTYELGKKHPQFGKPSKPKPKDVGSKHVETDADGNPEAARRAIDNANRRGSSASLGSGGSRREVTFDELTEEQAARLPDKDWQKLPKETRERLLGK